MNSRINGTEDQLSSLSCLMVNVLGYYDWINTSTHAFEISFLPSLFGTYAGQELSLGLLETPYKNDPPYDTYLLSVNTNGQPGQNEYAAGKYRAYKWLVMNANTRVESDLSTQQDILVNGDGDWGASGYYPGKILYGHYGYLSTESGYDIDVLCSTFDWWPGEVSKSQYDAMWKNIIIMAWGGRDLQYSQNPSMVFPPLYDPKLLNFNCFDTYGEVWLESQRKDKARQLFSAFAAELRNRYGSDWTRACSMNIHHFGTSLFEYGQLHDGVSRYRVGIVTPLLGFIDFLYGTSYNTETQINDIVTNSIVEPISARLCYPELLSACAVTQLSSPYMGWGGAGVDEHCRLFSQEIYGYKSYSLGFYDTNPKMSYANYVALCDFYRSFCTMEQSNLRHHVRFAVTDHQWDMDHVEVEREYEHYALADAIGVTINEDEGYAEFDIQYGHSFHQVQDISTYNTYQNHIETTRRQQYNFTYAGGGLGFAREFELNLSDYCLTDQARGLFPNPDLDADTIAWINRLFTPNPEEEREKDIQELTEEYEKDKKEIQDQIDKLEAELEELFPQYDSELYNAEIQLLTKVFPHFDYPIPQPVPHWPEDGDDWWMDWFYPGVWDVIENDPTLSTDELRDEREREMYQYTDELLDEHYSEGGEGYEIDMKWAAIFEQYDLQIAELNEQIEELTKQYLKDRNELDKKIYHPQVPSDEDILRILGEGIGGIGPVVPTGDGHSECITISRMKAVAPLSGLYGRVFGTDYEGNQISTNLNYWPAPIVMLGPEKEHILVREWLPYKFKTYSGIQPAPPFEDPQLSDYVFSGFSGLNGGIGYKTSLDNEARDKDQFNSLRRYCSRFWTSKAGNLGNWLGTSPEDIPWPQDHTEHQRVDFSEPVFDISVSEDLIGNPKRQKLVFFNGEWRSDLRVSIGGSITLNMSDIMTGAFRLGLITVGRATFDVQPRPESTMKYWTEGPNYEFSIYDQCNYMLRSARFTLH